MTKKLTVYCYETTDEFGEGKEVLSLESELLTKLDDILSKKILDTSLNLGLASVSYKTTEMMSFIRKCTSQGHPKSGTLAIAEKHRIAQKAVQWTANDTAKLCKDLAKDQEENKHLNTPSVYSWCPPDSFVFMLLFSLTR